MTADDLLTELEREIQWRDAELNALYRILSDQDELLERCKRRSMVPMIQAHAEGFVRFALQAYLRFISGQSVSVSLVKEIHQAWMLSPEFNRIRHASVDPDFIELGISEDNRKAKLHYAEAKFLVALEQLLQDQVRLDDSPLDQFDQNLNQAYLLALLFYCGLETLPHDSYATRLNGLVIRRNAIAHGESSAASLTEVDRWLDTIRRLFTTMRDEVYRAASEQLYLKTSI